jgi:hypothetical protein
MLALIFLRESVVYWYSIQKPLYLGGYASQRPRGLAIHERRQGVHLEGQLIIASNTLKQCLNLYPRSCCPQLQKLLITGVYNFFQAELSGTTRGMLPTIRGIINHRNRISQTAVTAFWTHSSDMGPSGN